MFPLDVGLGFTLPPFAGDFLPHCTGTSVVCVVCTFLDTGVDLDFGAVAFGVDLAAIAMILSAFRPDVEPGGEGGRPVDGAT